MTSFTFFRTVACGHPRLFALSVLWLAYPGVECLLWHGPLGRRLGTSCSGMCLALSPWSRVAIYHAFVLLTHVLAVCFLVLSAAVCPCLRARCVATIRYDCALPSPGSSSSVAFVPPSHGRSTVGLSRSEPLRALVPTMCASFTVLPYYRCMCTRV